MLSPVLTTVLAGFVTLLYPDGIVDVATRQVVRKLPRLGFSQQLTWSPDGRWLLGVSNSFGASWGVALIEIATGKAHAVSETERYNCTPDWMPDSRSILYSRGIIPETGGHAEIWLASGDGKEKRMLYAAENQHLYGSCASPDGKYLLLHPQRGRPGPGRQLANQHGDRPDVRHADRGWDRARTLRAEVSRGLSDRAQRSASRGLGLGAALDLRRDRSPHDRGTLTSTPRQCLVDIHQQGRRTHELAHEPDRCGGASCLLVGLMAAACAERREAAASPSPDRRAGEAGQHRGHGEARRDPRGGDLQAELYNYATVLKYQVLEVHRGKVDGETIYVGHYNPFKPRSEAADQRVHGHRRQSQVVPRRAGAPHGPGRIDRSIITWAGSSTSISRQDTDPIYWAVWTNLVSD